MQSVTGGSIRILVMVMALLAAPVQALEIAGTVVPEVIESEGNGSQGRLTLAGHAEVHRRYLPFYGITLHLPEQRPSRAVLVQGLAPCRLTLVWFANGLSAAQVAAYFEERFATAADAEVLGRAAPRIQQLLAALPGSTRGGVFAFDYDPDRGMVFEVNGEGKLALPGVEFNRVLLGLWLGAAADPEVSRALLAETR